MGFVRQNPDYPKFRMKTGNMPGFSDTVEVSQEQPAEPFDGVRRRFTLAKAPLKGSERVYKDGMRMTRATTSQLLDGDYFINYEDIENNRAIIFSDKQVPQLKSTVCVDYKYMRTS